MQNIFKHKGLNSEISWFYNQFKKTFEDECSISNIDLEDAIEILIDFLKAKKIKEILFFPEPTFDNPWFETKSIFSGFIKISELEDFLQKNIETVTNNHIADKELNWIFTIGHENDFIISGPKELVKECIKYFKDKKNIVIYH